MIMSTSYLEALRRRLRILLTEAREGRCPEAEAVSFIEDEVRASYHRGMEAGYTLKKDVTEAASSKA